MALPVAVSLWVTQYQAQQRVLQLSADRLVPDASPADAARWRDAIAAAGTDLLALQIAAAELADGYLAGVLAAQGSSRPAAAAVNAAGFADLTDGGGSWLRLLALAPVSTFTDHVGVVGRDLAVSRARHVAAAIVRTGMTDTARAAVHTSIWTHDVAWYIRGLRHPSCARCVVLAGRRYRSSTPFRRHKRCDCVHVPAADDPGDWTTDPGAYFRGLSAAEQDEVFGEAGARAIRAGADISQVVNAEQGVQTVNAYGRQIRTTTTGTTTRAIFGGYEVLPDGTLRRRTDAELVRQPGSRYRTTTELRLMPDEIFSLAEEFAWSQDEVLRQLRRFAYII